MVQTLRLTRYALLGTLFALVIAAASTLVSIGVDAYKTPSWLSAGIGHLRCGLSDWGWLPLPYCEVKSAARPDKVGPAMLMVAAILGVVLAICLLVCFERRQVETMPTLLTSGQESSASLPPPEPAKVIPHLPTAERPRRKLTLAERLQRTAPES